MSTPEGAQASTLRGMRLNSGSPERSSARLARSPRMESEMRASGACVSTTGRAPVSASMRSAMASFTRSALNRVLRSASFVPCAKMARLAPAFRMLGQGSSYAPSYRSSAEAQEKRPTTR